MGEHKHKAKESKKKAKKEHKKHKKSSSKKSSSDVEPEIDYSDPSLWVEKEADNAPAAPVETEKTESSNRQGWMLDESFDFGSLGQAKQKEEVLKPHPDEIKISERELNPHLRSGVPVGDAPKQKESAIKFGDAGSNWRMMKLKRIFEQAKEEGRTVEEVGLKRYGSHEKLQEALEEREYLDRQKSKSGDNRRRSDRVVDRYMFADTDFSASQKNFRRPGDRESGVDEFGREVKRQRRSTSPQAEQKQTEERASKALVAAAAMPVHTPVIITQHELPGAFAADEPTLTRDELNKLNSKLVKARLMGSDNVGILEKEYETQLQRFEAAESGAHQTSGGKLVAVLPTVDSEGRMYDYATPNSEAPSSGKKRYEDTHDKTTGERLKYGSVDNAMSVLEMFRQEKAGSRQSTDMDREFANRIAKDTAFENNIDYLDDRADIMASRKGMSEENKMRQAIKDTKRTKATLEACRFCFHDESPPQCAMISLGTRTYLALPNTQELVPGHCFIAPLEHTTTTLQCDDDVWNEIRNFQKCLMQMFNEKDCGVVFMETVTNIRKKRHTMIEAIPIPYGRYEDAQAYFKEAILLCEEESSQHKQLISTTPARGFRRSMVKELPYFHVWYELDKGYGHVIENFKDFPYWFGKEVIAGMLDIGPERWRRPKYHQQSDNRSRQTEFLKDWDAFDWTKQL